MKFRSNYHRASTGAAFSFSVVALALTALAAWATHIVWIISTLADDAGATFGQIALGAIGAFMPPVGMVHGLMVWFGVGF